MAAAAVTDKTGCARDDTGLNSFRVELLFEGCVVVLGTLSNVVLSAVWIVIISVVWVITISVVWAAPVNAMEGMMLFISGEGGEPVRATLSLSFVMIETVVDLLGIVSTCEFDILDFATIEGANFRG